MGNISFYHRDGKCYWRTKPKTIFPGTPAQLTNAAIHSRAIKAWRELEHDVQLEWSAIAKGVPSKQLPYDPGTHISGYNLFVSAYHGFAQLGDRELWERGEWFRIRSVFVAQLCEAVICTYEEIVAADVCAGIVRELLGWNTFGYGRPFQLYVVFQFSPGFDGPAMNGCVGELCRSACKDSLRLCPPVAFAVTVVE